MLGLASIIRSLTPAHSQTSTANAAVCRASVGRPKMFCKADGAQRSLTLPFRSHYPSRRAAVHHFPWMHFLPCICRTLFRCRRTHCCLMELNRLVIQGSPVDFATVQHANRVQSCCTSMFTPLHVRYTGEGPDDVAAGHCSRECLLTDSTSEVRQTMCRAIYQRLCGTALRRHFPISR